VVAVLEGADPALRGEAVVVGAHYDHLGHGGFGSMAPDSKEIHNGADDNASGTAALLAVAERLAKGPRPARTVVFIAFSGEESGLLGSMYYIAHPVVPVERTVAMLNMDMVGRLRGRPVIAYGTETAEEWRGILDEASRAESLPYTGRGDGFGASDQTSFYSRGIPVLHFFTNTHADYHRPSDDWEKIDFPGLERVVGLVARVALAVADRPARLTPKVSATPQVASDPALTSSSAYLGTIPDYGQVEKGVKIGGVRAGSPAEKAGIVGGDIIIGLGDVEVTDLYKYTDALRRYKPGERVPVRVMRDGKEITLTVVLGARSQ
jgi:hypothetical protein